MRTFNKPLRPFASAILFAAGLAGCAPPHDSGVATSKRYVDLETADFERLCDFAAAQIGGYDKHKSCDYERTYVQPSFMVGTRDECVAHERESAACALSKGVACEATAEDYELIWRSLGACVQEPGYNDANRRFISCRRYGAIAEDPTGPSCFTKGPYP